MNYFSLSVFIFIYFFCVHFGQLSYISFPVYSSLICLSSFILISLPIPSLSHFAGFCFHVYLLLYFENLLHREESIQCQESDGSRSELSLCLVTMTTGERKSRSSRNTFGSILFLSESLPIPYVLIHSKLSSNHQQTIYRLYLSFSFYLLLFSFCPTFSMHVIPSPVSFTNISIPLYVFSLS